MDKVVVDVWLGVKRVLEANPAIWENGDFIKIEGKLRHFYEGRTFSRWPSKSSSMNLVDIPLRNQLNNNNK